MSINSLIMKHLIERSINKSSPKINTTNVCGMIVHPIIMERSSHTIGNLNLDTKTQNKKPKS